VSAAALNKPELNRIPKLLRLLLIATEPGEIIAAIEALRRALASAGLDAHYVVDRYEAGAQASDKTGFSEPQQTDDAAFADLRSTVWFCWHRRDRLGEKERAFVENICKRCTALTDRQRAWILDIADRLERVPA
jgi:hypothetical protein